MRTILQVVPELETGGVERTAVDVAIAIRARGWRSIVASAGGRLVAELEAAGCEHIAMPLASKNPFIILANAGRLKEIVRTERVSLLHARSRAPAWSSLIAARARKIPFVTTYHGAYTQKGWPKALYNSVMARADTVIANSHFTAALIRERHPDADNRIVVIHRGTDRSAFAEVPAKRIEALRASWEIEPAQQVILHMARLTAWKGQPVSIDAFAAIAPRYPDTTLVLAGDAQGRASYVADLKARIAAAGLNGRVRLPGHCTDVAAAMHLADVVTVSSIEPEAFGRAAIEAQAAGTPVIVSDLGAVPETVLAPPQSAAQARTGWRVPAGDASALAAALDEALAQDEAGRTAQGERARAHARRFSLTAMTSATVEVYDRLLA